MTWSKSNQSLFPEYYTVYVAGHNEAMWKGIIVILATPDCIGRNGNGSFNLLPIHIPPLLFFPLTVAVDYLTKLFVVYR